mmetsp:Transcript_15298/g.46224  ORF Transcript_15298/g.46224 Transcript_15298/m.46224 type:complete len:255 (-) Transcript_15298:131-895(-)
MLLLSRQEVVEGLLLGAAGSIASLPLRLLLGGPGPQTLRLLLRPHCIPLLLLGGCLLLLLHSCLLQLGHPLKRLSLFGLEIGQFPVSCLLPLHTLGAVPPAQRQVAHAAVGHADEVVGPRARVAKHQGRPLWMDCPLALGAAEGVGLGAAAGAGGAPLHRQTSEHLRLLGRHRRRRAGRLLVQRHVTPIRHLGASADGAQSKVADTDSDEGGVMGAGRGNGGLGDAVLVPGLDARVCQALDYVSQRSPLWACRL